MRHVGRRMAGLGTAGIVAGTVTGLHDIWPTLGTLAAGDERVRILSILGAVGVQLIAAVATGLIAGVLVPFGRVGDRPAEGSGASAEAWGPGRTRHRVLKRFWALAGQARRATPVLLVAMPLGLVAVVTLKSVDDWILGAVETPWVVSILVTSAAGAVFVAAWWVGGPLVAWIERVVRARKTQGTWVARIASPTVLAWLVTGCAIYQVDRMIVPAGAWGAREMRPLLTIMLGGGITGGLGWALAGHLPRNSHRRGLAAALVAIALAAGMVFVSLEDPAARHLLAERTGLTRILLGLARTAFDQDGDGFADALGGGDCDDTHWDIHPGAPEIAGNGVDEDCDGSDLPLAAETQDPKTPPSPLGSPIGGLSTPYNIVLVTVDSLRPDHVGAYGYDRPTTPAIDALGQESVRFLNAYSSSSKTTTAVPSMLTGRYPSELERNRAHYTTYSKHNVFVAEVLQEQGFRTAGFVAHWYFRPKFGLGQGFETWEVVATPRRRMEAIATAKPVVKAAINHVELGWGTGKPELMWVHVLDPHKDYIRHAGVKRFGKAPIDRYDHEIRYCDEWIGKLLDALRGSDAWGKTVVILTADHGEAFGENGYRHHGFGLHEHQIRVPLLVRVPGLDPRTEPTRVSLIDLFPTLLELAGARTPGAVAPQGQSWVPLLGGRARAVQPMYAEMPRGPYNSAQAVWLNGGWKLHFNASSGHYELFDLATDPLEQQDLSAAQPERLGQMKADLVRFRAEKLEMRAPSR